MKNLALLILVCCGAAAASAADGGKPAAEAAAAPQTPKSKTEALVEASRKAKASGKRRKSTSRVITNADVKKSKGKIVETNLPPVAAEEQPGVGMVEAHEIAKKVSAEERARIEAAAAKVEVLEEELAEIEQQYYEENDLARRDREIVARFNDTKRKLDEARRHLLSLTGEADASAADGEPAS